MTNSAEPLVSARQCDLDFIANVERCHFRTNTDTGANPNAMLIWNIVREHFCQPRLTVEDLPAFCLVHKRYHKINEDYGCQRDWRDALGNDEA